MGVGRFTSREKDVSKAGSPIDLMARASALAFADCNITASVAKELGAVATVHMLLEHRMPKGYGKCYGNPSRVLCKSLGAEQVPARHHYVSQAGGYSPQFMINEMCERIASGEIESALVSGSEALATFSRAMKLGYALPGTSGRVTTTNATGRKTTTDASAAPVLPWGDKMHGAEPAPVELG